MSNSDLVSKKINAYSGNYTKGREGNKIKKITIHHCAAVMSCESIGNRWQRKGLEVSSHYGIGNNGKIGQYVDEKNTSYCDGNWQSNLTSVTIETSNNKVGGKWTVSKEALDSLIKLVADIAKRNDLGTLVKGKNLTWHSMYANTACPGDYLRSKIDYICEEANKINKIEKKGKTYTGTFPKLPVRGYFKRGDTGKQVEYLQKFLNWSTSSKLVEDGVIGSKTIEAIEKFQKKVLISCDGLFGKNSLKKAKSFKK